MRCALRIQELPASLKRSVRSIAPDRGRDTLEAGRTPAAGRSKVIYPKLQQNLLSDMVEDVMEKFVPVSRSEDGKPIRYLMVDDSVFARKNLARIVETFGGQVIGEAGDGVTAITEYERLNPDIVLMDITMPQMEGIEAAEKIVRHHPEARIVMVSSVGYQENIVAALQRGARHFVQKPVKPEVLYEVIKYVMRDDATVAQERGSGRLTCEWS